MNAPVNGVSEITTALSYIPAQERETWVRMAMAVKAELGEDGFTLWDSWSQNASNYNAKAAKSVWKGIKAAGGVTIATLFSEAITQGWKPTTAYTPPTPEERAKIDAERHAADEEAKRIEAEQREAAKAKAGDNWNKAVLVKADHPYVIAKGIKPFGAKQLGDSLVLPVRCNRGLVNLQWIEADGAKKFHTGGQVKGASTVLGTIKDAPTALMCEGWATGCSLHEATGIPVVVCFNDHNLVTVAKRIAQVFAGDVLVCGDNDHETGGNPGKTAAMRAANCFPNGRFTLPTFTLRQIEHYRQQHGKAPTDFNDLHQLEGLAAVGLVISQAISTPTSPQAEKFTASSENEVSEVSGVQPSGDAASVDTPVVSVEVSGVSEIQIPELTERPTFRVLSRWVEDGGTKYRPGVWHFGTDKEGQPTNIWVCSPMDVVAVTFDSQGNNFGRLLRFRNTLGRWREWAMPMEMLRGAGDDLRGELLAMGVEIDPATRVRNLLASYLQSRPPERRVRCALQVGWCGTSFVLPDTVIGPGASDVIFQSGERGHDEYTKAGTLEGWRSEIAAQAVGNPLLLLALSASFVGPMLTRCNAEGGGLHFVGDSSTGKTTLLEAACSTWGGPNYRRSWRATANGMEGAATLFNDLLMALDEISECDPREVGAIVYSLGNGRGKQRAGRTGSARTVARWRCFVLSSGERTIATTMQEGGHRVKAGQSVRLLDIPAHRAFGAWDNLHGLASGTTFSDAIKRAAATHYGHAGRSFLEKLTRDSRDFCALLERIKGLSEFSADCGEGQDKRAAARFSLLALAGEVATEYGLTDWPEGEAITAAAAGFRAWQSTRGRGNDERRQILERVSGYIARHGDGRFSNAEERDEVQIRERAGWWRDTTEGREYLFTAEGMREALKGFDFGRALDALQEAGALPAPGADGKRAKFIRIGQRGMKLYPIQADKLEGDYGT